MKKTAVIYTHAHAGDPNPSAIINAQEKDLRLYCKTNKIKIVAVFREITDGSPKERKELEKVCSNVRIGYEKPDFVLMAEQEVYSKKEEEALALKMFLATERNTELKFIKGKNILLPRIGQSRTAILYYYVPLLVTDFENFLKPQHTQFKSWCALHGVKIVREVVDWSSNRIEDKESFRDMMHEINLGKLTADALVMYSPESYSIDRDEYNWMAYYLGTRHDIEVVSFGSGRNGIRYGSLRAS